MRWREGLIPPKSVTAEQFAELLRQLPEPSPQDMLEASRSPNHPLYRELYGRGTQRAWAERGRMSAVRSWCGGLIEVHEINDGDKTHEVEVRLVEYVRIDGTARWEFTDTLVARPEGRAAITAEIAKLQLQAAAKFRQYHELTEQLLARDSGGQGGAGPGEVGRGKAGKARLG